LRDGYWNKNRVGMEEQGGLLNIWKLEILCKGLRRLEIKTFWADRMGYLIRVK
jgi:hypothetical protein